MKSKILSVFLIFTIGLLSNTTEAQTVKKSKLKFGGYGQKKFNKAEKKIFIEQFSINYQYIYMQNLK